MDCKCRVSRSSLSPLQISEKGKELVKRISRKEKEAVHEFVYARGTRELLSALWDGRDYYLCPILVLQEAQYNH